MYGVPSDEIDKIEFQYQRSRNEGKRKCKARSKEKKLVACVRWVILKLVK